MTFAGVNRLIAELEARKQLAEQGALPEQQLEDAADAMLGTLEQMTGYCSPDLFAQTG